MLDVRNGRAPTKNSLQRLRDQRLAESDTPKGSDAGRAFDFEELGASAFRDTWAELNEDGLVVHYSARPDSELVFKICTHSGNVSVHHNPSNPDMNGVEVGGLLVTGRKFVNIEAEAPGLRSLMEKAEGKVVFLGNGFSDYPLALASRGGRNIPSKVPVVVDLIDYDAFESDLRSAARLLDAHGHGPPACLEQVAALNAAIARRSILWSSYRVGNDQLPIPGALRGAALIVNVFGPSSSVLPKQLELLAKGSKLYFIQVDSACLHNQTVPSGFRREAVGSSGAYIFTKCA